MKNTGKNTQKKNVEIRSLVRQNVYEKKKNKNFGFQEIHKNTHTQKVKIGTSPDTSQTLKM